MRKKLKKLLVMLIGIGFLLGNIIAYNQAYKFSHFGEAETEKTKRPEELNLAEKLHTLFFGINIPKPKNHVQPTSPYETIYITSNETLEAWHLKVPESKGTNCQNRDRQDTLDD